MANNADDEITNRSLRQAARRMTTMASNLSQVAQSLGGFNHLAQRVNPLLHPNTGSLRPSQLNSRDNGTAAQSLDKNTLARFTKDLRQSNYYLNYLNRHLRNRIQYAVTRGNVTGGSVNQFTRAQSRLGNAWKAMAPYIHNRSDNNSDADYAFNDDVANSRNRVSQAYQRGQELDRSKAIQRANSERQPISRTWYNTQLQRFAYRNGMGNIHNGTQLRDVRNRYLGRGNEAARQGNLTANAVNRVARSFRNTKASGIVSQAYNGRLNHRYNNAIAQTHTQQSNIGNQQNELRQNVESGYSARDRLIRSLVNDGTLSNQNGRNDYGRLQNGHLTLNGSYNSATGSWSSGMGQLKHDKPQIFSQFETDTREIHARENTIRKLSSAADELKRAAQSLNQDEGNYSNSLTTSVSQGHRPGAVFEQANPGTMQYAFQQMGGWSGLSLTSLVGSISGLERADIEGNGLRQQIEPDINQQAMGNAINGGSIVGHRDNHITDTLAREGRPLGENTQQMATYLGALGGTRDTNHNTMDETAARLASFSRLNNVSTQDTAALFSTLGQAGGLGQGNNINTNSLDLSRQFAGMLHDNHLGGESNQQAQGLNSIYSNMLASGQTLTPNSASNVMAMQSVLSHGQDGQVFQGQQGAQQLNAFSQGVGSQGFNNMLLRNAFAGGSAKYGGQQGLYRLQMDMSEPLKHPQALNNMIHGLANTEGPWGAMDSLHQLGLGPEAAKKVYSEAMSGHLTQNYLNRIKHHERRTGKGTQRHARREYKAQGNSTLDIKVAVDQQGRVHTSESMDSLRKGKNGLESLFTGNGLGSMLMQGFMGGVGGSAFDMLGRTIFGRSGGALGSHLSNWLHRGRTGKVLSKADQATSRLGQKWLARHPNSRLARFGARHLDNMFHGRTGKLAQSASNALGGRSNANGNTFRDNYFYNNHFEGGSSGNGPGSSDNSNNSGNGNGFSDNSSSNSSGSDEDNHTADDARDDKINDLDSKKADVAKKYGRHSPEYRRLDNAERDLERDKRFGGLGGRTRNWLNNGRTGKLLDHVRGTKLGDRLLHNPLSRFAGRHATSALNWAGNGRTGALLRRAHNLGLHTHGKLARLFSHTPRSGMISAATAATAATAGRTAKRTGLLSRVAAKGGRTLQKGKDLLHGGRLARTALTGGRMALRGASTTSELSGVGMVTNAAISGGLALSDLHGINGNNFGAKSGQALGDALEGIPGAGLLPLRTIGGMAGYTLQHPLRAVGRVAHGLGHVGHFIAHPIQSTRGIRHGAQRLVNWGHRKLRNGVHHVGNFLRHPLRSTGRGLRGLGHLGMRSLRGLGHLGLGALRGAGHLGMGALRGIGRFAGRGIRGLFGRGARSLALSVFWLRHINRLLPSIAKRLGGITDWNTTTDTGKKGDSNPLGSGSGASGNVSQLAQQQPQRYNAKTTAFNQNGGNTTNDDHSNHDNDNSKTINLFPGSVGEALRRTGADPHDVKIARYLQDSHRTQ